MRFYLRLIRFTKTNKKTKQNKDQPQRVEERHSAFLATPTRAMLSKRCFILGIVTSNGGDTCDAGEGHHFGASLVVGK